MPNYYDEYWKEGRCPVCGASYKPVNGGSIKDCECGENIKRREKK